MRTIDVCYQVMYCVQLEVPDDMLREDIDVLIEDLPIPAYAGHSYVSDSFNPISVEEKGEVVEDIGLVSGDVQEGDDPWPPAWTQPDPQPYVAKDDHGKQV